jgi:hypothetical protein
MNFKQVALASMAWKPDLITATNWGSDTTTSETKTSAARTVTVPSNSIGKVTLNFSNMGSVQLSYKNGATSFVDVGLPGESVTVNIVVTNGAALSFRATNIFPGEGISVSVEDAIRIASIGNWLLTSTF